ncbi:hypothetical protein Golax_011716 [Gossypium laxum]|uniref:Uncharacterized protein n=1 Tax=Gossypium laxum TaxID=34288 RepID=A0A7J8ZMT9_9ROSI|nr:hypothetical protein [Gossypium laxum]
MGWLLVFKKLYLVVEALSCGEPLLRFGDLFERFCFGVGST